MPEISSTIDQLLNCQNTLNPTSENNFCEAEHKEDFMLCDIVWMNPGTRSATDNTKAAPL